MALCPGHLPEGVIRVPEWANGMTLSLAQHLIASARQRAEAMNRPVSIAVVDSGGHLVAFERMDGAPLISVKLAQDKAYTAALLRMPTAHLATLGGPGGPLFGIQATHEGRIVIFGGGEVLSRGAVGVSGGAVQEDVAIAGAAVHLDALLARAMPAP